MEKTRLDFGLGVNLMSLSSIISGETDGLSELRQRAFLELGSRTKANRLTHVGEGSLAGGGVERACRRGQLRGAVALRHADYGVGVAPAWFASFTLGQA